jgi:hypothetical protein
MPEQSESERAIFIYSRIEQHFEERMKVDIKTFTPLIGNGGLFPSVDSLRSFLNSTGLEWFGVVPDAPALKNADVGGLALAYAKMGAPL